MAKILYFSTHEPLEYDDILMLRALGHVVFSLGAYCPANNHKLDFSLSIDSSQDDQDLVKVFREEGCSAIFGEEIRADVTPRFFEQFDAVIAVQHIGFITDNWEWIKNKQVIWRTVGQAIDHLDPIAAPFRDKGMKIVRWSGRETRIKGYAGHDAVIRAYKDPQQYGPWTGAAKNVITFSNKYRYRYPIELGVFERVVGGMNYLVGGNNKDVERSTGILPRPVMLNCLASARAYFYCHGSAIPYTINFIEAWMTGVPVVALRRDVEIHDIDIDYNEINEFITHGVDGFLVRSETQARHLIGELLASEDFSRQVGQAGRRSAIQLFGKQKIFSEWKRFLESLNLFGQVVQEAR